MSSGQTTGQGAVPERPLLAPWLRIARAGDRLLLEHGDAILSLEGRAATLLLPDLLPLLDGKHTLEEVVTELGDRGPAAEPAIRLLSSHGCVVDGPAAEREDATLGVSLANGSTALVEADARLERARVAIVGEGRVADELARILAATVPTPGRVAWDDDVESLDQIVAAPSPAELPRLADWNLRMLELRVPWLPVLPFNGRAAFVGPLVLPGETACHACVSLRRAEAVGEIGDFLALQAIPASYPVGASLAAALAGIAALVSLRWLACSEPALPGALFAVELAEGIRVSRHRVLRIPRCHACSGTTRLPPPLPWAEERYR